MNNDYNFEFAQRYQIVWAGYTAINDTALLQVVNFIGLFQFINE